MKNTKQLFTKSEIKSFQKKREKFFEEMKSLWDEIALIIESRQEFKFENKELKKKLNLK